MSGFPTPEEWGWAALGVAWKSAAVLAGAGLVCVALRRSAAAVRHFVWGLALAGALALTPLTLALPPWSLRVLPAPGVAPDRTGTGVVVPVSTTAAPQGPAAPSLPRGAAATAAGVTPRPTAGRPTPVAVSPDPGAAGVSSPGPRAAWAWVWALGVWALGAATALGGPVLGQIGLRKAARGAVAIDPGEWADLVCEASARLGMWRRVTILIGDRALMPMTWGWLRPVVLLPTGAEGWGYARRRDVLLHELAHVRRLDCLTQAVAQLACAVYWFNPLAWLAAARMRAERERACDDLVLASGSRASDYAGHLLQMAGELRFSRALAPSAVAMARPSQLEGRLLAILDPGRRRVGPGRLTTALAVLAGTALLLPLSASRFDARGSVQAGEGGLVDIPRAAADGTMTVTGRVLDPDGKPVENAAVDLVGSPKRVWVGASVEDANFTTLARGETDGEGRFRLEAPRTSSARFDEVIVLAGATGYGLGWAGLKPDAARPETEVRLRPEQPVRVTLVDVTGMPARGVEVRVQGVMREDAKDRSEAAFLSEVPPEGLRAWPRTATTDEQGQFVLEGVGRDLTVRFSIRDIRFARQSPEVKLGNQGTLQEAALALEPARIIEGRILAADTGRPIPNAVIAAAARIQNEHANGYFTTKFRADSGGRFRINPLSSDEYTLDAFPPAGEPYLIAHGELKWVKAAVKTTHDFKLRRGVAIRGRVTEQGTGRPLAGASVQFMPIRGGDDLLSGWQAIVASGDDGVYQVAVPPGKGHLLVFGPTSDFILEATSERMVYSGKPGGPRYYAHKVIAYDVQTGPDPIEHDAPLRAGKTVTVRVVGPDGQAVPKAFYVTALEISPTNPSWRGDSQKWFEDGRFEVRGIAPDGTARVDILDDEHEWGASLDISGEQAGTELTVALRPCGRAKARFLRPDGRPVAKYAPHFEYIATPGPHPFSRDKAHESELSADSEYMPNLDRKHYWEGMLTNAEGRITLPSLIPGARYRISDFSTVNDTGKGVEVRKDFTVKPGETLDLGDILIEKPRG